MDGIMLYANICSLVLKVNFQYVFPFYKMAKKLHHLLLSLYILKHNKQMQNVHWTEDKLIFQSFIKENTNCCTDIMSIILFSIISFLTQYLRYMSNYIESQQISYLVAPDSDWCLA